MKNIISIFLSCMFIFSCAQSNGSKNLNTEKSQIAHSKLTNINNELSYDEYKLLIIKYGINSGYPDINK